MIGLQYTIVIRVSLCALQAFASERQMARMQEIADKKERGEILVMR